MAHARLYVWRTRRGVARVHLARTIAAQNPRPAESGKAVYTWEEYAAKFGFADIERIENREAAAKYITKYVTEDLARSVTEVGAHTYYASHGLKRAEVVQCGNLRREAEKYAFENDFVRIAWADNAAAFAPLFA